MRTVFSHNFIKKFTKETVTFNAENLAVSWLLLERERERERETYLT
jgi:hypothetical protein